MVGFRTPDDVVYLADCLSSQKTLDKYQIGFIYDVAAYLKTLEMVKSLRAKIYVPAHAVASEDVTELAQYQFDDYSKYSASNFDADHKATVKKEQFPIDCMNAAKLGKKLALLST